MLFTQPHTLPPSPLRSPCPHLQVERQTFDKSEWLLVRFIYIEESFDLGVPVCVCIGVKRINFNQLFAYF